MTKELNEQAEEFRNRPLNDSYPVLRTDTLYEEIRIDGRAANTAVLIICGVNGSRRRELLLAEVMSEESAESQGRCFIILSPRTEQFQAYHFRCGCRACEGDKREFCRSVTGRECSVHFIRKYTGTYPLQREV